MRYNERVGERLRSIRRQRGFSLQDVQRLPKGSSRRPCSGPTSGASGVSLLPRLHRLAGYYGVPVAQLLPLEPSSVTTDPSGDKVMIDLGRLDHLDGPMGEILERFLASIQVERQDFNGKVLTVRTEDLRLLSRLIGDGDTFADRLDDVRVADRPEFGFRGGPICDAARGSNRVTLHGLTDAADILIITRWALLPPPRPLLMRGFSCDQYHHKRRLCSRAEQPPHGRVAG